MLTAYILNKELRSAALSQEEARGLDSPCCIRIARSMDEVDELRMAWKSMQKHPNADFDFFDLVLRSKKDILRPHVITVTRQGVVESILVGRLELRSVEANVGYHRIKFPGVSCLTFIYGGLMGDTGSFNCRAMLQSIQESLRSNEATVAAFNSVDSESVLSQLVLNIPSILCREHIPERTLHHSMRVTQKYEDLFRDMSPKTRKNLKWQAKKLVSEFNGHVDVRSFRSVGELDELFRDVEAVACKTYQRALGVGFVDNELMRERLQMMACKGALRAFVLYLRDQPSAFWIGTLYGETLHSDFMGYDPQHGKFSPGMYLILKSIELFYASEDAGRISYIDFGLGDAQYKEVLGDKCWQEISMYLFAPTARGIAINLARTPIAMLNRWAVWCLQETKVLPRAKKLWRQWRRQSSVLNSRAN